MNSATDIWPEGLGCSSDELGQNIMDHHLGVGAFGIVEGYDDKYYYGRRANGIYIPKFRNVGRDNMDSLQGFGYQCADSRVGYKTSAEEVAIGVDLKEALKEPGRWVLGIDGFRETLSYHGNKITMDKIRKDKWGLNIFAMDVE